MSKNGVFISYSHEDTEWLKKIRIPLKQLENQYQIEFWDDTKIEKGTEWEAKIDEFIDHCQVALLLVSGNFLASSFINEVEIPGVLKTAKQNGAKIFILVLDTCIFDEHSPLYKYQCLNDISKPLEILNDVEQKAIFVQVAKEIRDVLTTNDSELNSNGIEVKFENKLISILILTILSKSKDEQFSMKSLSNLLIQNPKGLNIKRKSLYNILIQLHEQGLIIKEKNKPTQKEKSSTFWRISELGFAVSQKFNNSYESIS